MTYAVAQEALRYCNSYNRVPKLIALWLGSHGDMSAEDWLRVLGEEWSACDNIGPYLIGGDDGMSLWDTPLGDVLSGELDGSPLMDEVERAAYAALPEQVAVWRGCYDNNKWGLSWSLDRNMAEGFPKLHRYRQDGQPLLVRALANKSGIAALKLDRGEAEIITYRPRHISTSKIRMSPPPQAPDWCPHHARRPGRRHGRIIGKA